MKWLPQKWTAEEQGDLRTYWATELTASQIAKKMGVRFTRNMIIGKARRMALPSRDPVACAIAATRRRHPAKHLGIVR